MKIFKWQFWPEYFRSCNNNTSRNFASSNTWSQQNNNTIFAHIVKRRIADSHDDCARSTSPCFVTQSNIIIVVVRHLFFFCIIYYYTHRCCICIADVHELKYLVFYVHYKWDNNNGTIRGRIIIDKTKGRKNLKIPIKYSVFIWFSFSVPFIISLAEKNCTSIIICTLYDGERESK